MPAPLTPDDLEDFIRQHGLNAEVLRLDAPTPTVEAAAEAAGVSVDQIVKSLLFLIEGGDPVLVIAAGTGRIDRRKLAAHFGTNRRKTHFADAQSVLELTGFPVGAVPPFGHRQSLGVLVDPAVLEHDTVLGGGGSGQALLRLDPQDILRLNRAEVLSLQKTEE